MPFRVVRLEALLGIKQCEKRLPLKYRSFQERSHFPWIWFQDLIIRFWGLEIKHLKAHNPVWQGCFFFHYYLATSTINWAHIFTGLLFKTYVEIHQVRGLVFNNYQRCPVSLTAFSYKFYNTVSRCTYFHFDLIRLIWLDHYYTCCCRFFHSCLCRFNVLCWFFRIFLLLLFLGFRLFWRCFFKRKKIHFQMKMHMLQFENRMIKGPDTRASFLTKILASFN